MENYLLPKTALIFVLGSVLACCKEDPPPPDPPCMDGPLPCHTQEGKNTFGCYIDGAPFVAAVDYNPVGPVALSGSFNEDTKWFSMSGTRENENDILEKVYIYSYILSGLGDYEIDITGNEQVGFLDISGPACEYYFNLSDPGFVKITYLDTSENIISGTFNFTLRNADCVVDSIMVISDGRFDYRY